MMFTEPKNAAYSKVIYRDHTVITEGKPLPLKEDSLFFCIKRIISAITLMVPHCM